VHLLRVFLQILEECQDEEWLRFAPDESATGTVYFFLAQLYIARHNYEDALSCFEHCGQLHWSNTPHHQYLLEFAMAKTCQSLKDHQQAIDKFTLILEQYPHDAYSHFRRAWSYKVRVSFVPKTLLTTLNLIL
jgi:tetratricopeptide (TPR) repeat protein